MMAFRPSTFWFLSSKRKQERAGARPPIRTRKRYIPRFDWLEDRTLLSGSLLSQAAPLDFNAVSQIAVVSHFLSSPTEADLYSVMLTSGQTLNATISPQAPVSALASTLRVFNAQGAPVALDDQQGGDPQLRFQAAATGEYYIGVSSAPNDAYDPTLSGGGANAVPGATTGLYTLDVQLAAATPLASELIGSSIRLGQDIAVPGDAVPVQFTVQNRGGLDPGNFSVEVLLAGSDDFANSPTVAQTLTRAELVPDATGRSFSSPAGFAITVPANQPTGPLFVGVEIIADPHVASISPFGDDAERRGANFASLAVLTAAPAGTTDLSAVDPNLNVGVAGTLLTQAQVDTYTFTVPSAGLVTAEVDATGGTLVPRLTLADGAGNVLLQSDSGSIIQHLDPGTYEVSVSAQTGVGSYRLGTQFTPTQDPFLPPTTGKRPTIAVADLTGDGIEDLITADYNANSVSVMLGAGDGSFEAPVDFPVGVGPLGVAVADLTGDGIPDIVTANYHDGTVSVLLGNGDGTFQPARTFTVGDGPLFPVIADLTGDGIPDIVTANYDANTVSVLIGNGDGAFQPQVTYAVGAQPAYVSVADVTGDGRLDILCPNFNYGNAGTVSVLLNNGNGAFGAQTVFAAGNGTFAVAAADFTGNGHLDLVAANRGDNTVSILMGNGAGSFGPPTPYPVGNTPYALAVADLAGDGRPDVVVANRNDDSVSVLLGDGNGTFQPQEVIPVGQRPLSLAVADVSDDGKLDILVANADDNTVSVLLGNGDGTFSYPAGETAAAGKRPFLFAVGDLNGDGYPDIVTADSAANSVSVLLGGPDGSFQPYETFPVGNQPIGVALAHLDGNNNPLDLIVTNKQDDTISVLMGDGHGGFGPQTTYAVGGQPLYVTTADLTGDGKQDIIVTDLTGNEISVLLGNGDGTFQPAVNYATGGGCYGVAVADVNGDGKPDIVVSNYNDGTISVILGNGDGTFQPQQVIPLPVGSEPAALLLGDLSNNNKQDIVVALTGENEVAVLMGNGAGAFQAPAYYATGNLPTGVALADLTPNGIPDIVVSNRADNTVSVLLGNGDGTFQPQLTFAVGRQPFSVAAVDVTGDGIPDIITANASDSDVSLLVGNGDGTFQPQQTFALAKRPYAMVVADVAGDGDPATITANYNQGTVSVRLGNGNGSFQAPQSFAVGNRPDAVAVADLNHDGRLDLVVANSGDDTVSVLLGNGDGTFQPQETYAVGGRPDAIAFADLTGDGIPDLIVSNYASGTISVLIGNGDGTFQPQKTYAVGNGPDAVAAAELTGDGHYDLAVTNIFDDTVSVLLGNGNGTFQPQATYAVGAQPYALAVADLNGDNKPDLVAVNYGGNSVSVLLGNGNGAFQPQQTYAVGQRPVGVAVADLAGNGSPDLVVTNRRDGTLSILQNNGGTFTLAQTLDAGTQPVSTAVANVNGDGRPSIITVDYSNSTPRVLLASATSFTPATAGNATESVNNTYLADVTGDGVPDSVILDASGEVLFRQGLADGAFAPPVVINVGRRARDLAIVNLGGQLAIATADSSFDPALSAAAGEYVYTVSLYTYVSGSFVRSTAFTSDLLPTRIIAADLTGDGLDDIVVADSLDNRVQIAFQQADHTFSTPLTLTTGEAPSNLAATDLTGDGLLDIVCTDQASGDVTVFLNDATHSFSTTLRFRAGLGLFGLDTSEAVLGVASLQQSVSLAAGDFTGDGLNDLAVVNRGTDSITVLLNDGHGGFDNVVTSLLTSTSDGFTINDQAGAVVAGEFTRNAPEDLAVLMENLGQVWIYTGTGQGTFRHSDSIPVGDQATGLTVVPEAQGLFDLLVGNGFGDVLQLVGRGDGTFQISGSRVSLSVVPDLLGPGEAGVLVGNQADNRVTVQGPTSGGNQFAPVQTLSAGASQLAPGDVQWFYLDRNATLPDAVVVSAGSNAVVVYRTTGITDGVPTFAPDPQTFFVGTAPAGITVADITGNGIPDMLISNQGSNDISVVFGSYDANGHWQGTLGPRLKTGGDGPIAVTVSDLGGNGVPDLVVTNGGAGTMTELPGVGQGFFDDRDPPVLLNMGNALIGPPTYVGDSGLGYVVTAGGDLERFDLDDFAAGADVVFAGHDVVAAEALASGDVAVVVADGTVDILKPDGNQMVVASELYARAGVPTLPSSLDILQKSDGQFEVLVSSEGSDTIFVFAQGSATEGASAGHGGLAELAATIPIIDVSVNGLTSIRLDITGGASGASGGSGSGSGSGSASGAAGVGFSLGSFSFEAGSTSSSATAVLVALQGNSYSTVAVLDFGSLQDDAGAGRRMPWLSVSRPFGDTSPLTRFVIGQDEAARQYRDATNQLLHGDDQAPLLDPWRPDLFHRRLPAPPPMPELEDDEPMGRANPGALFDELDRQADPFACPDFLEPCAAAPWIDVPGAVPHALPAAFGQGRGAGLALLAFVLGGALLPPALCPEASERAEEQMEHPPEGKAHE